MDFIKKSHCLKWAKVIICLCCTNWAYLTFAQNAHELKIVVLDTDSVRLATISPLPKTCANASDCITVLQNYLTKLQNQSYLTASIDSIQSDSLQTTAYLFLGAQYEWLHLKGGNVSERTLSQLGFREKLYEGKPFRFEKVRILQEKLLVYAENNGYPFSSVSLKNVAIEKGNIAAELHWEKHRKVLIDSVLVNGRVKIGKRYLFNYLNLKPGQVYNEATIRNSSTRIRELSFLQELRRPTVTFIEDKAKVSLNLKRKKASKFDLLLGVVPSNQTNVPSQSRKAVEITGEGQLNLQNALGEGELIAMEFQSYPAQAKELNVHFLYPYLPLLPIGGEFKFDLYLRDTLYRKVDTELGLQYIFKGNNLAKVFVELNNSSILSVDSARIATTKRLPDILDVKSTLYGLAYNFEKLDYRLNPRKGFHFNIDVAIGNKKVKENNSLLVIGDATLAGFREQYEQLNANRLQYRVQYAIDAYLPLGKRATFKTSLAGAVMTRRDTLQNELFRIGGNQLLRGYEEESLLASAYNVLTLEYRYLLAQNSYFFLFWDGAYRQLNNSSVENVPFLFGFGLGTAFETKAGVFGISYALGKEPCNGSNPDCKLLDFRSGKIHFGYVNYF